MLTSEESVCREKGADGCRERDGGGQRKDS